MYLNYLWNDFDNRRESTGSARRAQTIDCKRSIFAAMHRIDFHKRRDLPSVPQQEFKGALRHFASGVTVVTAEHGGERYGITVSAFASISIEPPIVMVSINNTSP